MNMTASLHGRADLALIVQAIRRSSMRITELMPTVPARRREPLELPPGYELTDIIILDWIAAQASRARQNYLPQ
jgi:hypothetical protein